MARCSAQLILLQGKAPPTKPTCPPRSVNEASSQGDSLTGSWGKEVWGVNGSSAELIKNTGRRILARNDAEDERAQ